jgi:hypothetical protein
MDSVRIKQGNTDTNFNAGFNPRATRENNFRVEELDSVASVHAVNLVKRSVMLDQSQAQETDVKAP